MQERGLYVKRAINCGVCGRIWTLLCLIGFETLVEIAGISFIVYFFCKYSSSLVSKLVKGGRIVIIRSMWLLFLFLVLWPNRCSGGFRYSRHLCLILSFLLFFSFMFASLLFALFLVLPFPQ